MSSKRGSRGLIPFYLSIWNLRPHYSEVSSKRLFEFNPVNMAHILEKRTYPEWMLNSDNIVLLTFQEHQMFDSWRPERLRDLGGKWAELMDKKDRMKRQYEEEFGSKLRTR